jgi:RNA polymerase sigma-70 factor, ECF subfamily
MGNKELLNLAKQGDIKSFNDLFIIHQPQLRGYLYRMLTDVSDTNDIYHDTFIKCFDNLKGFEGTHHQLKGWIFRVATNLALNYMKLRKRWSISTQDVCRESLIKDKKVQAQFVEASKQGTRNHYDITEHIDFCFTCISKTLTIEQQTALLLKDVVDLKIKEIATILNLPEGKTKHLVREARVTMSSIYKGRCSLINKNGTCYQCTELSGLFNPERDARHEVMKLELAKNPEKKTQPSLYKLRKEIVQAVHPTEAVGADLHDLLLRHLKKVNELN